MATICHSTQSRLIGIFCLTISLLLSFGCHRQYYRKQADCEVNCLIDQKANHVARSPNIPIRIDVDRQSRMFNPFDLDFQPMPVDDPASNRYMQCVDGRRGYPMWEAAGVTNAAESPDWWQFLPLDEDGVLVLDAETAVRLALLHSPDYQFQVEQLYLSALAVSAQRFQFDTQFFGGSGISLDASDSSTQLTLGSNRLALQRNLATGGQLLASIANSITWELSGPTTQSANTILDFSLIQPLLRRAGRDVVLEGLTSSERALLANIRSFERFRRSFYLAVTIGRGTEGTFQTAGSGIGNVGGQSFNAGGFLGLLQTELQIRNSEENIARQSENLLLLEDSLIESLTTIPEGPGEIVSQRLQVAQARSRLLSSQSGLVRQQASFQSSLDQFLRTLGLPPYLCVRLDDPILDQFELIDRNLLTRNEQLIALRRKVGEINTAVLDSGEYKVDPESGIPVLHIEWSEDLAKMIRELRTEIEPLIDFPDELIETNLPVIEQDIARLGASLAARRKQTQKLSDVFYREKESICGLLGLSQIDESIFEIEELGQLSGELEMAQADLRSRLEAYKNRIEQLDKTFITMLDEGQKFNDPIKLASALRDNIVIEAQDLLADIGDDVLTLQLIQARARTESVLLPEIDIDPQTALQIARQNRRDWANARAALVDAWRTIEVVADDLESDLDIVFSGDVSNIGSNPLNLQSSTGNLRVGLQWDAPITRLLERNDYRAALIGYERTKRDYYQFEDSIWQLLRAEVRQLHANRLTFELGRQAIRIAAEQIDLNTDRRSINEARGGSLGPTAARDAIDALSALLDAQNSLLNIYVNYEVVRRGLDFDMGTMELTPDGQWVDPGEFSPELLLRLPGTGAGGLDNRCNECCLPNIPQPAEPEFANPFMDFSDQSSGTVDMDQASGLMDSSGGRLTNPVHVARLPSVWEASTKPTSNQAKPTLVRPTVNVIAEDASPIESR